MTLHEIEETLHTLQSRHSDLNEGTLITLLRSGGWEEKNIQEAVFLFRSGLSSAVNDDLQKTTGQEVSASLPPTQSEPVFMPQPDENHLLLEHNEDTPPQEEVKKEEVSEPQSLVPASEQETPMKKKEELPHNLPLRPFETSDHIWPFSRYRDVFYGETDVAPKEEDDKPVSAIEIPVQEEAKTAPAPMLTDKPVAPVAPVVEKLQLIEEKPAIAIPEKRIETASLPKGDGKLVVLACVMLVIILLLLGYMYSNGRL